jgi:hypothetical protein
VSVDFGFRNGFGTLAGVIFAGVIFGGPRGEPLGGPRGLPLGEVLGRPLGGPLGNLLGGIGVVCFNFKSFTFNPFSSVSSVFEDVI